MKKMSIHFLMLVIVGLFITGCGPLTPATPEMQGKVYTQVNMWEEKSKTFYTNYQRGRLIPINSEVIIHGFNEKVIEFSIKGEGDRKIEYINIQKYSYMDTPELFEKIFSKKKVNLRNFSSSARSAIEYGTIKNGMTKKEVIAARGFPPAHVTVNLESNIWKYWQNRFVTRNVMFKNGRVSGLAGWGTGVN